MCVQIRGIFRPLQKLRTNYGNLLRPACRYKLVSAGHKKETFNENTSTSLQGLGRNHVVDVRAAGGVAHAETTNFKGSYSGTNVNVPIDQDSDSCFTGANGALLDELAT
jgi:hypothetical protein